MRNDKTLGQKILDYISKSIILLKIIPPEDIIKQLKLNKELTAFFQQENVLKKNHESIFLKEFKITFIRLLSKHGFNLQASDNPALNFLKNNQPYLPPDGIYRSLKSIGYEQLRAKKDNAKELYRICHELSPPDKKLESNFFLIWPSIYMNNYPEVVRIIKQTNMLENFDSYNPNLKFWIAYSFQKNNELILAKSFYQKIIQQNHLDYYSIISIKALKSLSPSFNPLTILENTKSFTTPSTYKLNDLKKSYISTIRRALLWLDQGREDFYKMEIDTLLEAELSIALKLDAGIKQKSFKTWLVLNLLSMLNNKGYYLNTFKLAFDSLDKDFIYFSLPLLKTLFPMSYFSKIKEIESGVDPIITLSLIRQESAFNPRARSIAGATGLMQLLPSTAQFLNGKIKKNQLHNPDINLSLGILYLEKLLKKYNGNLIYSLSAYNAGEKRLGTWIKEYFLNQDPVVIVESIPFEETKNYVKLIYRNIFFYKYLSNDTGAFLPVEDSFSVFPSH